jgi:hypothetical protein
VDLMIVVVSVLIMVVEPLTSNAEVLMALRVLRALKPLRMLTRSEEMRIVVKSLMLSVAAMANVSLFCLLFFVIFAILGTQLFMGLFSRCGWKLCTSDTGAVVLINCTQPAEMLQSVATRVLGQVQR